MKLTAEQIESAYNAIVAIGKRNAPLPTIASFKLVKMHDRLLPTFREIEKKRFELIHTYGEEIFSDPEKTKSTGQWSIPEESGKREEFLKEMKIVSDQEFEIPLLTPISLHMIGNEVNGLNVTEIASLGPLIVDPSEEKEVA